WLGVELLHEATQRRGDEVIAGELAQSVFSACERIALENALEIHDARRVELLAVRHDRDERNSPLPESPAYVVLHHAQLAFLDAIHDDASQMHIVYLAQGAIEVDLVNSAAKTAIDYKHHVQA